MIAAIILSIYIFVIGAIVLFLFQVSQVIINNVIA